ncbi:hypothetical protein ACVW0W_003146 [Bradyrhizobium sp. USDA 4469]
MRTWLLVAISLIAAALFGQAPEFAQQYTQRLGGAIDELDRIVSHFDEDSRRSGYDRAGALALMGRNQEQLIRDQATRMSEAIDRLARLRAQQSAMNQPGAFTRVAAFANGYDQDIASRAWRNFQFALPISVDSVLFMSAGFIASLLLLWLAAVGLGRLARREASAQ